MATSGVADVCSCHSSPAHALLRSLSAAAAAATRCTSATVSASSLMAALPTPRKAMFHLHTGPDARRVTEGGGWDVGELCTGMMRYVPVRSGVMHRVMHVTTAVHRLDRTMRALPRSACAELVHMQCI